MDKQRPIDKVLAGYQLRDLQSFRNILISLDGSGFSIAEALKYIHYLTFANDRDAYKRKCPECDNLMSLYPVNTNNSNRVGGKYRCQWYCHSCSHSIFIKRTVPDTLNRAKIQNAPKKLEFVNARESLAFEIASFLKRPLDSACPDCGKVMELLRVCTPVGRSNIYGYKSVWFCDNCLYEKYLKHDIKEEAIRLRRI